MPNRAALARYAVPFLLVGTALVIMIAGINDPQRIIFDEVYYVNDARDILEFGVEQGFVVHPPLGKIIISGGIRLFGDSPFGWRVMGGVAGAITVWLVYLIGLRLFRRTAPAAAAALFLALDGVFIVQARTAMLDIYLAMFTVLGAWFLLKDRDQVVAADAALLAAREAATDVAAPAVETEPSTATGDIEIAVEPEHDAEGEGESVAGSAQHDGAASPVTVAAASDDRRRLPGRDRTWLWLAGIAFGAAVGVKWSGLLALGGAGLLVLGWELSRRRTLTGSWFRAPTRLIGLGLGALVLAPVLVYGLSWIPWFQSYEYSYQATKTCDNAPEDCSLAFPNKVAALGRFHKAMADFHLGLEADHPYRAPAYTWPILARPVVYYYESCSDSRLERAPKTDDESGEVTIPDPCRVEKDDVAEMLAVGNPMVWWGFLAGLPILIFGAMRRDRMSALPLMFYAVQFLPWLIVSRPVFSFYTVPIVPFVALGLGAMLTTLLNGRAVGRVYLGAISAGALGLAGVAMLKAMSVLAPTRAVYLVVAGVGFALGGALAAPDQDEVPSTRTMTAGRWALGGVTLIVVGLAIYFLPVWTGLELPTETIKQRWWFRGWI